MSIATATNSVDGAQDEWGTPADLWAEIQAKEFDHRQIFDPCPNRIRLLENTIVTPDPSDGLILPWDKEWFCNPPFSKIEPWIRNAIKSLYGTMLIPVRADQPWWHLLEEECLITFIRGRVNYINPETGTTQIIVRDKKTREIEYESDGLTPKLRAGSTNFASCLLTFQVEPGIEFWWPECHKNRRKPPQDTATQESP